MGEWLPIESAPRDGTLILVCLADNIMDTVSWWGGGWRETGSALRLLGEPKAWMPLPPPPEPQP